MEDPRPAPPATPDGAETETPAKPEATPEAESPTAAVEPAEDSVADAADAIGPVDTGVAPAASETSAPTEDAERPPVAAIELSRWASSMLSRTEHGIGWLPPARLDVLLAVLLGVVLLGVLLPFLGVWEPWEAQQSAFAVSLREAGTWFVAELPKADAKAAARFELPYSWWLVRVSLKVFGENEFGLRLPGFLASLALLATLMASVRALWGRLAGWLSVLALLSMPLFVFHGRQNFGAGLSMAALGIGTLALVRRAFDPRASSGWAWLGWLATAASALTGATVGLVAPVAAGLATALLHGHQTNESGALRRLFAPGPTVVAVVLISAGWGAALAALPAEASPLSLLYVDAFDAAVASASLPTFERITHQLGFGLFPLGALLPFAFGTALWRRDDEVAETAAPADAGLALGFAVAFLATALFIPLSARGLFPGAALVAAAVGIYLARTLRAPPSPVLAMACAMVLMLLDSNLKHEPRALADALVSTKVDQFPPELAGWSLRRLVSGGLIAALLLYQGGLVGWIGRTARFALYPQRRLRFLHLFPALTGVAVGVGLWVARLDILLTIVNQKFWGPLTIPWRNFLVLAVVGVLTHAVTWVLYNLWVRRTAGRTEGRLSRLSDRLQDLLTRPNAGPIVFSGMLCIAAAFMSIPVALSLTANFSQKNIVERFSALSKEGEALFKYRVDAKTASFYTRGLPELTAPQFKEKSKGDTRFFAVVPRPQLAAINSEFRAASSGQTLPVLDATSYRFLLVSNRLEAGETDENPITQALLKELPKEKIRPSKVNYDDQIELAGWYIDPPEPKTGARITITLYWRALKKVTRNWKVFMHIDAAGARVHGDHEPVEGLYPTSNWNTGDIIKDVYSVPFAMSNPAGRYTVWAGLYTGDTRAPVKSGDKDNENRAKLGFITVR